MVYVEIEDSKDGLKICKKIQEIYFNNGENIEIKTFGGMVNLKKEIKVLDCQLKDDDSVIIVYDRILDNPIVRNNLFTAKKIISKSKYKNKYKFIGTVSFELEVLLIDDIEYFADIYKYCKYMTKIKSLFQSTKSLSVLTEYTKNNHLYDDMYKRIKNLKRNKGVYKGLSDNELEQYITIESLSKEILKDVFREQPIDKPMTQCWMQPCCWRKKCTPKFINVDKIISEQNNKNDKNVKANIIISNTSYRKIVHELNNKIQIHQYSINDFIDINILEAAYIAKELSN